jgi:hypothetical protein
VHEARISPQTEQREAALSQQPAQGCPCIRSDDGARPRVVVGDGAALAMMSESVAMTVAYPRSAATCRNQATSGAGR